MSLTVDCLAFSHPGDGIYIFTLIDCKMLTPFIITSVTAVLILMLGLIVYAFAKRRSRETLQNWGYPVNTNYGWSSHGGSQQTQNPMLFQRKRSKCFACEASLPAGKEWLGQPSKCFDCEAQLQHTAPFQASRTLR